MARTIDREELPHSGTAYRFEGNLYGDTDVSFFLSDMPPGQGPGLHTHPYDEVFVIQEGTLTFRVGDATLEAKEEQIVSPRQVHRTGSSTPERGSPGTSISIPVVE